jgi:hypothetical protein
MPADALNAINGMQNMTTVANFTVLRSSTSAAVVIVIARNKSSAELAELGQSYQL